MLDLSFNYILPGNVNNGSLYQVLNNRDHNLYAYVLNNPLNFIDPLGLDESSLECVEDDFNTCVNGGVGGGGSFGPGQCAEVFIDGIDVGNTCGGGNGPVGGDGGGGGGGGGDGGATPPAPKPPVPPQSHLQCAAAFGQQFSIAGILGLNATQGTLAGIGKGLLGNDISSVIQLFNNPAESAAFIGEKTNGLTGRAIDIATRPQAFTTLGLTAESTGAALEAGQAGFTVLNIAERFAPEAAAKGLGAPITAAKAIFDATTVGIGLFVCSN